MKLSPGFALFFAGSQCHFAPEQQLPDNSSKLTGRINRLLYLHYRRALPGRLLKTRPLHKAVGAGLITDIRMQNCPTGAGSMGHYK